MPADAKKILLIVLYCFIALGVLVALAFLLRIPVKKETIKPTIVVAAPATESPQNLQNNLNQSADAVPEVEGPGTTIIQVFNNQDATSVPPGTTPTTTSVAPPSPTKPAISSSSQPAATSAPAPAPVVKPAQKTSTQVSTQPGKQYWIQVASFSSKLKAENMQRLLAEKSLTSYLQSSVIDGKTWYRVRVGPYTSKTDAERWLATVKKIPDCGASYIVTAQ
mgnify:CR=1 FL=1